MASDREARAAHTGRAKIALKLTTLDLGSSETGRRVVLRGRGRRGGEPGSGLDYRFSRPDPNCPPALGVNLSSNQLPVLISPGRKRRRHGSAQRRWPALRRESGCLLILISPVENPARDYAEPGRAIIPLRTSPRRPCPARRARVPITSLRSAQNDIGTPTWPCPR